MADFFPLPNNIVKAHSLFYSKNVCCNTTYLQLLDYIKQDCLDVTSIKKKFDSFTIISVFLKYRLSNSFEYYN